MISNMITTNKHLLKLVCVAEFRAKISNLHGAGIVEIWSSERRVGKLELERKCFRNVEGPHIGTTRVGAQSRSRKHGQESANSAREENVLE